MTPPAGYSAELAGTQRSRKRPVKQKGLARERHARKLAYREILKLKARLALLSSAAASKTAPIPLLPKKVGARGVFTTQGDLLTQVGTKPDKTQPTGASRKNKKKDKPQAQREACEFDRAEGQGPLAPFDSEFTKPFWAAMSKWSHDRKEKDAQTNTRVEPDMSMQVQTGEKKKKPGRKKKKLSETSVNSDQEPAFSQQTEPAWSGKRGETGTDKLNKSAVRIFKRVHDVTGEYSPEVAPIMQGQPNLSKSQKTRRSKKMEAHKKAAEPDQVVQEEVHGVIDEYSPEAAPIIQEQPNLGKSQKARRRKKKMEAQKEAVESEKLVQEEIQTGDPISDSRQDSAAPSETDTDDNGEDDRTMLLYLRREVYLNEEALRNAKAARDIFLLVMEKRKKRRKRRAGRSTGNGETGTGDEKVLGDARQDEGLTQEDEQTGDAYQPDLSQKSASWEGEKGDAGEGPTPGGEWGWPGPILENDEPRLSSETMRLIVDDELETMRKTQAKKPMKYNRFRDPRRGLSSSNSRFAS